MRPLKTIKSLYKMNRNYMRTKDMESEDFFTKGGLKQGMVFNSIYFTVVINKIQKKQATKEIHTQDTEAPVCAFTDDFALWIGNIKDVQKKLNIWQETIKK